MAQTQKRPHKNARSAARLAAVQALYQREMEKTPLNILLDEFHQYRLGATIEDATYTKAEPSFFDDIVRGVGTRCEEIDRVISENLSERWSLDRLDRPMRQILRAGTYDYWLVPMFQPQRLSANILTLRMPSMTVKKRIS